MALNATVFIETFHANQPLGSPVLTFIVYIDNTYFRTPQAMLIYLVKQGSFPSFFTLDNKEESDSIVFTPEDDLPSRIQYTRRVVCAEPAEAGEYQLDLVVSVLAREELSGELDLRETRVSSLHVTVEGKSPPTQAVVLYTIQDVSVHYASTFSCINPFRAYSGYIHHGASISLWELIWGA